MDHYMPVRLHTGKDCLKTHGAELAALGGRCLIVTGRSSARRSGALDAVCALLASLSVEWAVFDGVAPNPTVESCIRAGAAAREHGAAFLLGIGGGSVLDAAKAAAVFAADAELDEAGFYSMRWLHAPLPLALVGLTAGTGSEVTNVSVLTDSAGRKHSVHDDRLYARSAFGDPVFTASLPRAVTVSAGFDAIAHCAESYLSRKADEISRACSVRGIARLVPPLKKAVGGEELTLSDRAALYEGSILGGLAISSTGTVFPHNLGYLLTERFGLAHGAACAVFFPDLLDHAERHAPGLLRALLRAADTDRAALTALARAAVPENVPRLDASELPALLERWETNGTVQNTLGGVERAELERILRTRLIG